MERHSKQEEAEKKLIATLADTLTERLKAHLDGHFDEFKRGAFAVLHTYSADLNAPRCRIFRLNFCNGTKDHTHLTYRLLKSSLSHQEVNKESHSD